MLASFWWEQRSSIDCTGQHKTAVRDCTTTRARFMLNSEHNHSIHESSKRRDVHAVLEKQHTPANMADSIHPKTGQAYILCQLLLMNRSIGKCINHSKPPSSGSTVTRSLLFLTGYGLNKLVLEVPCCASECKLVEDRLS